MGCTLQHLYFLIRYLREAGERYVKKRIEGGFEFPSRLVRNIMVLVGKTAKTKGNYKLYGKDEVSTLIGT